MREKASPIPPDFPDAAAVSTVSGAQEKFTVALEVDADGGDRYRAPGNTADGRAARYAFCLAVVEWSLEKVSKPAYAGWSVDRLLRKLTLNLQQDFFLPPAERDWVLDQVRARLAAAGRAV